MRYESVGSVTLEHFGVKGRSGRKKSREVKIVDRGIKKRNKQALHLGEKTDKIRSNPHISQLAKDRMTYDAIYKYLKKENRISQKVLKKTNQGIGVNNRLMIHRKGNGEHTIKFRTKINSRK